MYMKIIITKDNIEIKGVLLDPEVDEITIKK